MNQLNRYQILSIASVILISAAVSYKGLSLLVPIPAGASVSDRIAASQAQREPAPALTREPLVEAMPLRTQIIHSSRWSSKPVRILHSRPRRTHKPEASTDALPELSSLGVPIEGVQSSSDGSSLEALGSPSPEEIRRRLELGLVPEAIVLPKHEELEVSSLILVKN